MADKNQNTAEETDKETEGESDDTSTDTTSEEEKGSDGDESGDQDSDDEEKGDEDDEDESDEDDESSYDEDEDDFKPEVRKNPWSNRKERADFFKGKKGAQKEGGVDVEGTIRKVLSETLSPLQDTFQAQADKGEIDAFLANPKNADFKPFADKVAKAAKVYPTVPISQLFRMVGFDAAKKLGATKAAEIKVKEKKNKVAGSGSRGTKSGPDVTKMSDKEFDDFNNRILSGERLTPEED